MRVDSRSTVLLGGTVANRSVIDMIAFYAACFSASLFMSPNYARICVGMLAQSAGNNIRKTAD